MAEFLITGIASPVGTDYNFPIGINNPRKVTVSSSVLYRELVVEVFPYVYNISLPLLRLVFYPNNNNQVIFDISEIIKSIFPALTTNNNYTTSSQNEDNIYHYSIVFRADTPNINIKEIKTSFIRGGSNTLLSDTALFLNPDLNITPNPLYWNYNGLVLPSARYSYSITTGRITKSIVNIDTLDAFQMPIKGCDYTYVKFLNHMGGFSYWLFENTVRIIKSESIGHSINYGELMDLGVEVSNDLILTTKVDKEYLHVLKSLIYSPMVYIWNRNSTASLSVFRRVVLQNNTITENASDKSSFVSIKLNQVHNYNPSVIW